jgi:AcrR family transcriptional regulator
MAVPYELGGRTRQKGRTRSALVSAARELLATGVNPTVEEAARAAEVSRTTAYRYFPNQQALLVATYPEIQSGSLLGEQPPGSADARLELVTERFARQLLDHEPELRAMLRVSLEGPTTSDALPLRRGRALRWIEDALEPLRDQMTREEVHDLAVAIRGVIGIEPLVWLTDVAGLTRPQAAKRMRRSAAALLRDSLRCGR